MAVSPANFLRGFIPAGRFYHFIRKLVSLKFKLKIFRKIMFTFKSTNISTYNTYLLTNLKKNPYDFINIQYQLISFEKAEILNEIYNLHTSINTRTRAWVYDLFLKGGRLYYNIRDRNIQVGMRASPAFYLDKREVKDQYCWYLMKNKFCPFTVIVVSSVAVKIIRVFLMSLFKITKSRLFNFR